MQRCSERSVGRSVVPSRSEELDEGELVVSGRCGPSAVEVWFQVLIRGFLGWSGGPDKECSFKQSEVMIPAS